MESLGAEPRVGRATVVVLGALSAMGPLSLRLPNLATGIRASVSAAQPTLAACLVGLATGQLLSGPSSDAVRRHRPLLIGAAPNESLKPLP